MKRVKIILGIVFSLAAVYLAFPLAWFVKEWADNGYSPRAFAETGLILGQFCIVTALAVTLLRSALRKRPLEPSRRWYQFSLRSLLLYGAFATVCISWMIVGERELSRREAIKMACVTAIEKSGGKVPSWQRDGLEPLGWVKLTNDSGLKSLGTTSGLAEFDADRLDTVGPQVSDAGLEYLKQWRKLRRLQLTDSHVTGSGLQSLRELPELCHLGLVRAAVTPESLDALKEIQSLESLLLNGKSITDMHLKYLKSCKQLKEVTLVDTSVTEQGIQDLRDALPNCEIKN